MKCKTCGKEISKDTYDFLDGYCIECDEENQEELDELNLEEA